MQERSSPDTGARAPLSRNAKRLVAGAVSLALVSAFIAASPPNVSAALPAQQTATDIPESFAELVRAVRPAVVNISTKGNGPDMQMFSNGPQFQFPEGSPFDEYFRDFFGHRFNGRKAPKGMEMRAMGSGFIFDAKGFIATNNHVIENADEITVILDDGSRHEAELVGRDPKTDLAVLKIDTGKPLPYVEFGDSDQAEVGDWVVAVGNPFGLGGSVTAGIVSARGRDIQAGPFDDYLQIDAPINRGNSGGPLFNRKGEVVGVNTAIYSPSGGNVGIGFAVPSNMADSVVATLRDEGRIERGWIGVHIQALDEHLAKTLALESTDGALVATVVADSPAATAGLAPGDVILNFAGKPIENLKDLTREVAATDEATEVPLTVWRDGKRETLTIEVGDTPEHEQLAMRDPVSEARDDTPKLGLRLAKLTPQIRARFGLPDAIEGVLIADVALGSPAANEGLQPGDIILKVGDETASEPSDVVTAVRHTAKEKDAAVLLLISRDGAQRFVALPLANA